MSRSRRRLVLGALSAALIGGLAACTGASSEPDNPGGAKISVIHEDTTYHGAEPAKPYRMPDITLTADNGEPFNLVTGTGYPVTLIFFGYTNCPDVCPLVLNDLASAYVQLPSDVRSKTQVLFVTTDPARDTQEVLRSYLARYNPSFVGITGRLPAIKTAAADMGVAISGTHRLPDGGYDVGHSSQVIGFRGNLAPVLWTAGTAVPDMVADVIKLAGQ